jgi:TolB protein
VELKLGGAIVVAATCVVVVAGYVGWEKVQPQAGPPATAEHGSPPTPHAPPAGPPLDWQKLEAPLLTHHVQVTSRTRFVRAGEQYFSPDSNWLVFQAVAVPPEGKEPDPFYAMYVGKIQRDGAGHVTGLEEPIRISPPDSANTCGWFDPVSPYRVLFGSTLVHPKNDQKSGFSVQGRKYVWMFPEEMDVVSRTVPEIFKDLHPGTPQPNWGGEAVTAEPVFTRPNYDAECSYSADGRFILYAHVRDEKTAGRPDADIWVYDTQTKEQHPLVIADGYDGGPFFSPDGKMICYRSDRSLDDLLQLYVAELVFDARGVPIGIKDEKQLTSNGAVNWAPYWHPSGKLLVYGSSFVSHQNYEVFAVEVDMNTPGSELRTRRVTWADGADVLPVFSRDGKLMTWCSQRGPKIEGEAKSSSQVWIAECVPGGFDDVETVFRASGTK